MHRAPLLLPAAGFLSSIIAQAHGYGVAALCFGFALAYFRYDLAMACMLGFVIATVHGHPPVIEREWSTSRYIGSVVSDVRSEAGTWEFGFAIDGIGTLRAIAHRSVRAGERLIVRARVAPIDQARNPGEPSPRAIALDEGLVGELSIQEVIARCAPDLHDPRVWTAIARDKLSQLVRAALPEPQATVLAGALWGERGTLPQPVRDDFQATGTVHVLVTAGLHLGVIAALIGGCFTLLQIPRVAASLMTIPVIFGYAWLSGWHLPSQRAAVMIAIALLARACGARALSLNTLAIAAIVVAACRPVAVESVSFALSFSCVGAIVLFAETIAQRLAALRIPGPVAEALALTLATQIGVWPLTAAVFFTVAPYAMLANAIVVPLVGLTMIVGIGTVVTHPFSALSDVCAQWDCWLLAIILATTHGISTFPGARLTMTPPPIWSIALYDAAVIAAALVLPKRPLVAAITVVFACAGVGIAASVHAAGSFSITALDVGQGDALVVRTPHGRTIVIDSGGRLERGPTIDGRSPAEKSAERIVLPYLQRAGISRIDLMILTHPHGDHVGGFSGIVRSMPVGWIADSGQHYGGQAYNDGLREAQVRHVPIVVPACRQRWVDDEVSLTFLTPCGPQFVDGKNDINENSLVVLIQCRAFRALFMGDAGFQSEQRLLAQDVDIHADLLKVGHHGSAYSSSEGFLEAVHPRFALISVGRHNLFGHPAAITLEELKSAGAATFRTDRCGAVTVESGDADQTRVTSMLPCAPVAK